MRKIIFLISFAALAAGCSTISEESCIEGSWESLGYEEGRGGASRGHFTKISETCAKYGIAANATDYWIGYDQGLPLYCSYDKGLAHGESGRSLKAECREINATAYLDGYDEGWEIYEIKREYEGVIDDYAEICADLLEIDRRLSEDELDDKDRKRLRKKQRRLETQLDSTLVEIRAFERAYGWPRRDLTSVD